MTQKKKWSDGKLLTVSIVLIVLFWPVGVSMLVYYFVRKSRRPMPPIVPWSAWDESIHRSKYQADRMHRAMSQDMHMKRVKNGIARFKGSSGDVYYTSFGGCTCPDFVKRGRPCKHMYALAIKEANFDPSPYIWVQ